MKAKIKLSLLAATLLCATVCMAGCGNKSEATEDTSKKVTADSPVTPERPVYETVDTKVTETPEEAKELLDIVNEADSFNSSAAFVGESGEGIASDIPDAKDCKKVNIGDTCKFTNDDGDWYSVTVTDVAITDRPAFAAPAGTDILLVTYTYSTLTADPVLVDDMSFRCELKDGTTVTVCALEDQLSGELATPDVNPVAEIAYAIPSGTKEVNLYLTNNAIPEGNTFVMKWTAS